MPNNRNPNIEASNRDDRNQQRGQQAADSNTRDRDLKAKDPRDTPDQYNAGDRSRDMGAKSRDRS